MSFKSSSARSLRRALLALGVAFSASVAGSAAMAGPCPDPAITSMRISGVSFEGGQAVVGIRITVHNRGAGDFVSNPNQQSVLVFTGNSTRNTILRQRFARLASGASFSLTARLRAPGGEFTPSVTALLSYDPDIYIDGNPRNDDCNQGNNQRTLSAADINDAIAAARSRPRYNIPDNAWPRPVPLPSPIPFPWRP